MPTLLRLLLFCALGGFAWYMVDQGQLEAEAAETQEALANAGCTVASPTPVNGEMLVSTGGSEHKLTIHNAPGTDAVVKLKDRNQETVLAMYVRAGATASTSVPNGNLQFQYATGRDYSTDCGRFLQDMQASKDPVYEVYETTQQGNYIYTSEVTYTLERVSNGNFQPSKMSNSDF